MVTKRRAQRPLSLPCKTVPLSLPRLSVEELEYRLETVEAHMVYRDPSVWPDELCQCDGQECIGVCPSYCLIRYG